MKKLTTLLFLTFAFTMASMAQIVLTIDSANYVDANGVPLDTTHQIQISGVVEAPNFYPTTNGAAFMLTSHTHGIQVYAKHRFQYTVNNGDSIVVVGKISTYHGMAEISPSTSEAGDTIYRVGTGIIDTPIAVTPTDLAANTAETYEARLIKVYNVDMSTVANWPATHASNTFTAHATSGGSNLYMFIDSFMAGDLWNGTAPAAGMYTVVGFGNQYVSTAPFLGEFSIMPRKRADFILQTRDTAGITAISSLTAAVYPNPASTKLTVRFDSQTSDVYTARIVDLLGNTVLSDNGTVYGGSNEIVFNTNALSNGMYVLEVNAGGKTLVAKVSISK